MRSRTWPKGFPWLSKQNADLVAEANEFVLQCINACYVCAQHGGWFLNEHPEDLGVVYGEVPGSIWQWDEINNLLAWCNGFTMTIHQCQFGALTSKLTRLMCNFSIEDRRCHKGFPTFKKIRYLGPLPEHCGHNHVHKLMGKTGTRWNTSPSAAYPPGLCQFIADEIFRVFTTFGGGKKISNNKPKVSEFGLKSTESGGNAHRDVATPQTHSGQHPTPNASAQPQPGESLAESSSYSNSHERQFRLILVLTKMDSTALLSRTQVGIHSTYV